MNIFIYLKDQNYFYFLYTIRKGKVIKKKNKLNDFSFYFKKNMRCKPEMSILLLISFNP